MYVYTLNFPHLWGDIKLQDELTVSYSYTVHYDSFPSIANPLVIHT